ncbi:EFR1 family ferrodoxin [Peloplasma aerotolerans]|uniref:EFR1 family ferrodoxin n=1 Tax=Peloplasma aerotolerans TaxID=3044389 RepID=A0AAW6U518_9MOLU|nr:EFR1 family ferrodoxin [Mariniplasma sp. M4Ah]MDI6453066.1 EFR1 family ferrodoxin [Mariniplasma sp. M4Ah]
MKIAIFLFSGTGNTYFIGKKLQDGFKEKSIFCDLFTIEKKRNDNQLIEDYDVIGLGYPIYGSDVPLLIKKWIDGLKMQNHKKAFVFCTQMMYSGDSAAYGGRLLEKKGFIIRQQAHFNMPNNITDYKILRPFNKHNLKKIEQRKNKQVNRFVKKILIDKKSRKGSNLISLCLGLLQRIPYQKIEMKWISDTIKIEDQCILCEKCIELCPTENFEIKDGILKTKNMCIACYRCINHCPVNALHSSKNALVKYPYKGPVENFNIKDVMEDCITTHEMN